MPPLTFTSFWTDPRANLAQLFWPALAVGYRYSAMATRMTRSAVLGSAARGLRAHGASQGLWERAVVLKHALSNALLPIVTVIGLEFAFLLGGLVVTEQVFNLNGIGMLFRPNRSLIVTNTMTQALVLLGLLRFYLHELLWSTCSMPGSTRAFITNNLRAPILFRPGSVNAARIRHWLASALDFISSRPLGGAGAIIIVLMIAAALLANFLAPYDPWRTTTVPCLRRQERIIGSVRILSVAMSCRASFMARVRLCGWAFAHLFSARASALLNRSAYCADVGGTPISKRPMLVPKRDEQKPPTEPYASHKGCATGHRDRKEPYRANDALLAPQTWHRSCSPRDRNGARKFASSAAAIISTMIIAPAPPNGREEIKSRALASQCRIRAGINRSGSEENWRAQIYW